jgi:hypothetical protein
MILFLLILFSNCKDKNLLGKDSNSENFWTKNFRTLSPAIQEEKFTKYFQSPKNHLEGSGVFYYKDKFYIVFDNLEAIGVLNSNLKEKGNLIGELNKSDFEAITFDEVKKRFYIVVESVSTPKGYMPEILEFTEELKFIRKKIVNFPLEKKNKGIEGLTVYYRKGEMYLLALCEGNLCYSNKDKHRGKGRIQVLKETDTSWNRITEIKIPIKADFLDYSDMDIDKNQIIILSQESSSLWVGELSETKWEFISDGESFRFPFGNKEGEVEKGAEIIYCNLEGISYLSPHRIVVVSDKMKEDQDKWCKYKEEMIHIFDLPIPY